LCSEEFAYCSIVNSANLVVAGDFSAASHTQLILFPMQAGFKKQVESGLLSCGEIKKKAAILRAL
jgi:hypothetical protein